LTCRIYSGRTPPDNSDRERRLRLDCPAFFERLEAGRMAGAIVVCPPDSEEDFGPKLDQMGVPWLPRRDVFEVHCDYAGLIREGLRSLREAGARNIAVVGAPFWDPVKGVMGSQELRELYRELDQQIRPHWLQKEVRVGSTGAGWEAVMDAWSAYPDKPDGLLVSDDVLFGEAAQALMALGVRVPEQLMVVSHAVTDSGAWSPFPMLRLEISADEVANLLAQRMIDTLRGKPGEFTRVSIACRRVWVGQQGRPIGHAAPSSGH
jgi:DNA-binding LacI/PurR family transcriptional regulator